MPDLVAAAEALLRSCGIPDGAPCRTEDGCIEVDERLLDALRAALAAHRQEQPPTHYLVGAVEVLAAAVRSGWRAAELDALKHVEASLEAEKVRLERQQKRDERAEAAIARCEAEDAWAAFFEPGKMGSWDEQVALDEARRAARRRWADVEGRK